MAFTPVAGSTAKIKVSMTEGTANTTLPGVNWKLNYDPKLKDVSNFRDGRFRAATLEDATIDVTLVFDAADPYTKAAVTGLRGGVAGSAELFHDGTKKWVVPIKVGTIGETNEGVEGVVMVDVQLLQHNGAVIYPSDS